MVVSGVQCAAWCIMWSCSVVVIYQWGAHCHPTDVRSGGVRCSGGAEARLEAWSEVRLEAWLDVAVVRVWRHGRRLVAWSEVAAAGAHAVH